MTPVFVACGKPQHRARSENRGPLTLVGALTLTSPTRCSGLWRSYLEAWTLLLVRRGAQCWLVLPVFVEQALPFVTAWRVCRHVIHCFAWHGDGCSPAVASSSRRCACSPRPLYSGQIGSTSVTASAARCSCKSLLRHRGGFVGVMERVCPTPQAAMEQRDTPSAHGKWRG